MDDVIKHCGLCAVSDHYTNQCPQLKDVASLDSQLVARLISGRINLKEIHDGFQILTINLRIHPCHIHNNFNIPFMYPN